MCRCRRLIGDGTVAQGHTHNGRHVSLGAKHVDGDPSGLPCEGGKRARHSSFLISSNKGPSPHDSAKVLQVLPDAWHFLCKTKYAAQVSCQIFTSKQIFVSTSSRVCSPLVHGLDPGSPTPRSHSSLPGLAPAPQHWPFSFLHVELSSQTFTQLFSSFSSSVSSR